MKHEYFEIWRPALFCEPGVKIFRKSQPPKPLGVYIKSLYNWDIFGRSCGEAHPGPWVFSFELEIYCFREGIGSKAAKTHMKHNSLKLWTPKNYYKPHGTRGFCIKAAKPHMKHDSLKLWTPKKALKPTWNTRIYGAKLLKPTWDTRISGVKLLKPT